MAFRAAAYWDLEATFDAGEGKSPQTFPAKLTGVDGERVAQGRDFSSLGALKDGSDVVHLDEATAGALAPGVCRSRRSRCRSVEAKPYRRSPVRAVPDDDAAAGGVAQARLRRRPDDADRAAAVRERLHHLYADRLGHVVGHGDQRRARQVTELYGRDYLPDAPRTYQSKVKNAQEAHEAIRPSGEIFRTPAQTGLQRRRVPALRADLDAHRGVADAGRRGPFGVGADRGDRDERRGLRVLRSPAGSSRSTAS